MKARDDFSHISVGDFVAVPRIQMPSLRYEVIRVTPKHFRCREVTHGWLQTFRKADGRSVGGTVYRFAKPTDCNTVRQ